MNARAIYPTLFIFIIFLLSSCAKGPQGIYGPDDEGIEPDYSNDQFWAALPWKKDNADQAPKGFHDRQSSSGVDVFYLHPTMYYGKKSYDKWNAPIFNKSVNKDVDNTTLTYQATAWNGVGRIFAPRYRQAHIKAYFHKDKRSATQAFELAYRDVKSAFLYYLDHHNGNRPFIIASHSQGTTHAQKLIKEVIDGTLIQDKFIAGYLLGIPVDMDQYETIQPCEDASQTECLVSWRTWKKGSKPDFLKTEKGKNILITNPLSWNSETSLVPKSKNKGSVLLDFEERPKKALVGAQIYESILWTDKPRFKWSWLMTSKNYHRGDINLFWVNIRENANQRVASYYKKLHE